MNRFAVVAVIVINNNSFCLLLFLLSRKNIGRTERYINMSIRYLFFQCVQLFSVLLLVEVNLTRSASFMNFKLSTVTRPLRASILCDVHVDAAKLTL